jgi:hypothetical protein
VVGFLRNLSEIGKLPAELRGQLEAEGVIFTAGRIGVVRHFSGHVPGVYSSSGVSRYQGGFGFSNARIVATFPARGDANLRSIDCSWDTDTGPGKATVTDKGLQIEINLCCKSCRRWRCGFGSIRCSCIARPGCGRRFRRRAAASAGP